MEKKMNETNSKITANCAMCTKRVCPTSDSLDGPENCPTKTRKNLIKKTFPSYEKSEVAEFARQSSIVEGSAYIRVTWSRAPSPLTTRLEEIISLASRMGFRKLGVAFCVGLADEAKTLVELLMNSGFEVVSVCCKTGGIAKERIGIKDSQKINPGQYESMCNPVAQAEILNDEGCDFNIMLGLCVGHDSLFLKHIKALTTVFAVKDRLLGHNPLAALYQSRSYYRRLHSKDLRSKLSSQNAVKE
jgi:uncharacterized metal-binding protein